MSQEILDYVNEQLFLMKQQYEEIRALIKSKEIEAEFIDKCISKIRKQRDNTKDVLLPEYLPKDFESSEINNLIISKRNLNEEVILLNKEKEELWKKISRVKNILDNSYEENKNTGDVKTEADIDSFKIQELDRERISRDIHDGVVQNLTALIRKMEFISLLLSQDTSRARLEINDAKETLKESLKELREIIYDLRPMSLDDLGFEAGFYNVCSKIKESYTGVFEYNYLSDIPADMNNKIDKDIFINILRIIRELCSNSIKYSNGNYIYVSVEIREEKIILTQSDDGNGFDYVNFAGAKRDNTGFGLLMLKERVKAFNGDLVFNNEMGSKYIITFPINLK